MRRLRILRVAIPVLLLPLLALLVLQLQPKPQVHNPPSGGSRAGPRAESMNLVEFVGERRSFAGEIGLVSEAEDGSVHLEEISRLLIEREGRPPLIVRADLGGIEGDPGSRRFRLQGGVEVREEERGLEIMLPELQIDQAAGEARSLGAVELQSPEYVGSAQSVLYGLEGQPTRLRSVDLREREGEGRLRSERATLYDGTRDVEFEDRVRLERPDGTLRAARARARRRGGERLERLTAAGGVSGRLPEQDLDYDASELRVEWDEDDRLSEFELRGKASLVGGPNALRAERIVGTRQADGDTWSVDADGEVRIEALTESGPGVLETDAVHALLEEGGLLRAAEARGGVDYRSEEAQAQAERAALRPGQAPGEIELIAGELRRARLVHGRTRVTAEKILTERSGGRFDAQGRVEALLLPGTGGPAAGVSGPFRNDQAVHFVARRLLTDEDGQVLTFSGDARGWQGDRTLAGQRVVLDQRAGTVLAEDQVDTRIPRQGTEGSAFTESDFVHVTADRLRYDEREGVALYEGNARAVQEEGFIEAGSLRIDFDLEADRIREIRAFDSVRLELEGGEGRDPVTGDADRLLYLPAEASVVLYGDDTAATVRRITPDGALTSRGRVLRYRLDLGTLEIDSGDPDRVRIRTSAGGSR